MKQTNLTPELYDYCEHICLREHPVLKELRESSAQHPLALMQSPPLQVQFLQFLIRSIQAKRILEIGTFTGYATLGMALALPDEGQIITCDSNATWTQDAPRFWQQAQQDHKIQLILGPALPTVKALDEDHTFDFIYIDADKTNYVHYYEEGLRLLSAHGMMVIDNIFWDGRILDPNEQGGQTKTIRALNQRIQHDDRVECAINPMADGLFLIQKKLSTGRNFLSL